MSLKSINPYTGELIRETREISSHEIEGIISGSVKAFDKWKITTFRERSSLMKNAAALLRKHAGYYANVMTSEMGKPIKESQAEIEKCAWVCEYYSDKAESFLKAEVIETDADKSYVSYEPLGVILGIMPWNFPFWQVFRFAVPAIMAGNTALLKHASNVQLCAEKIMEAFEEAGFPPAVFRNLALGSSAMETIIRHSGIVAVSLTGSEQAGAKVAAIAGSVLKKCVLELGGSNAFIVLADADLEKAAKIGVQARFQNAGQSCIAAKRFIVEKKVSDRFIELFRKEIGKIRTGDPSDENTQLGPLCNVKQAEAVADQLKRTIDMGAKLLAGGKADKAFFMPTLVIDVQPGMPLFDEEVFGPVAPVTIAKNVPEAIRLAGKTTFGLGVSLFTNDIRKAEELSREFHDGSVFINGLVKSDPRLPFGGTRRSGFGRELSSHGIREFVNVKTIWIRK